MKSPQGCYPVGFRCVQPLFRLEEEPAGELDTMAVAPAVVLARQTSILKMDIDFAERDDYQAKLLSLKEAVKKLLGPFPNEPKPSLLRDQYGQTRWHQAKEKIAEVLYLEEYVYGENMVGRKVKKSRKDQFLGTPIEKVFSYFEDEEYTEDDFEDEDNLATDNNKI